jgi:signal transduction histidine kinase
VVSVSDLGRRLPVPPTGDELARLVATLNEMLSRLQTSFEHERRFVDDASHELRTPLAILKAELDLALARARTPEELDAAVRSASAEADRLVALANDLLVYSRADGGRVPIHRSDVRLDELLNEACAAFAGRAHAARVDVTLLAAPRTVSVDMPRVRQAVENVLDNAIRNTPPGGRIEIRADVEAEVLRIIIEDSGEGFPPEIADRAFEPFARGSSERASASGGAGLGLAIVHAIVTAHGGTAVAENRSRGGARIKLELPAEPHLRLTHL